MKSTCVFPLSPDLLIEYTKSDNEQLRLTAFQVLEGIRHPVVRRFALELLEKGEQIEHAFGMMAKNFQKSDKELLLRLVQSFPISYKDDRWHSILMTVRTMFDKDGCKNAPKELLWYSYENNLCSFCRKHTLYEMGRRRMLTPQLLNECLYDSNDEIRQYAKKHLK